MLKATACRWRLVLTPGQRHEATALETLLTQGAVAWVGPGWPRLRSRRIVNDKGYTGRMHRAYLPQAVIREQSKTVLQQLLDGGPLCNNSLHRGFPLYPIGIYPGTHLPMLDKSQTCPVETGNITANLPNNAFLLIQPIPHHLSFRRYPHAVLTLP